MRVTCRDAAPADLAAVAALFRASFTATFGRLYAPADLAAFLDRFTPAAWAAELAQPGLALRLAELDGAPVGFAKLGVVTLPVAPAGPALELRQLYLAGAAQGRGIGDALMAWVLATARARGAGELFLSVFVGNHRARSFYARHGFVDVGPYTFMVGDHRDEDRLLRLAL